MARYAEIDDDGTSFQSSTYPWRGRCEHPHQEGLIDELTHLLRDGGDHARLLVKGIGVYRRDELDYLTQVDTVSLIPPS